MGQWEPRLRRVVFGDGSSSSPSRRTIMTGSTRHSPERKGLSVAATAWPPLMSSIEKETGTNGEGDHATGGIVGSSVGSSGGPGAAVSAGLSAAGAGCRGADGGRAVENRGGSIGNRGELQPCTPPLIVRQREAQREAQREVDAARKGREVKEVFPITRTLECLNGELCGPRFCL